VISKRLLDLIGAACALAILAPVFVAIALCVGLTLGRPILFAQVRPGLKGVAFRMYKFRTMSEARDPNGRPLPDKDRLTAFGRFLRRTSLDELPELVNVIKGEMSLVGPRPLLMEYLPLYTAEQARRHDVPPGITGWAQVNGRNAISWAKKFEYDVWYVDHRNLVLDVKILALTLGKVLSGAGVSKEGHVTTDYFKGTGR
jgi:lipopolysaccharide/colanic/teichoic acid biosynthesis glycosyltransferase